MSACHGDNLRLLANYVVASLLLVSQDFEGPRLLNLLKYLVHAVFLESSLFVAFMELLVVLSLFLAEQLGGLIDEFLELILKLRVVPFLFHDQIPEQFSCFASKFFCERQFQAGLQLRHRLQ